MRNPTRISLGATESSLLLDLHGSWGALVHVCAFRAVNCPGAEATDLQSEIRRSGRCKHHSLSWEEGDIKEPLRNKHYSLGENGELFLGWWCLCLSAPVLIVICAPTWGVKPASSVCAGWEIVRVYFCLLKSKSLNPEINNYRSKFAV